MVSLTATPLKVGPSPGTYDDAPALSDLGDQACTERPEGANPRLLAWLPGSDSCSSSGAVSRPPPTTPPPAPEEEEEKAISVRKKSDGHPRNPKRCGLPCSPMAKVERGETVRKG